GSCACRKVKYEVKGDPIECYICHCTQCRKSTGSSFHTIGLFKEENFRITHGAESLRAFDDTHTDSGRTLQRRFCGSCGSQMFGKTPAFGPILCVMIGTIDQEHDWSARHEIFAEQRRKWVTAVEGARQWPALWSFKDRGKL
ncbi:hypothetical protein PUNSTDRAFT_65935, partial [Punctularia strigosozonata HHB-11173 SS5]|uniref:uncharacterized protein n=1 Tax=Punctularia strigosozonata (strain HHB-11173) TaxID=741275 RepID=UPI0004417F1D